MATWCCVTLSQTSKLCKAQSSTSVSNWPKFPVADHYWGEHWRCQQRPSSFQFEESVVSNHNRATSAHKRDHKGETVFAEFYGSAGVRSLVPLCAGTHHFEDTGQSSLTNSSTHQIHLLVILSTSPKLKLSWRCAVGPHWRRSSTHRRGTSAKQQNVTSTGQHKNSIHTGNLLDVHQ